MIEEAVNQTQDNQGLHNSIQATFTLHEHNHPHDGVLSGGTARILAPDLGGTPWSQHLPVVPAERSTDRADQHA